MVIYNFQNHNAYGRGSVHSADDLLGYVGQLLLVPTLAHGPDALHGGLLVLVGQHPGLLQPLALHHQPEGRLHVARLTESPQNQTVKLRELLTRKQDGGRGQAKTQVSGRRFS